MDETVTTRRLTLLQACARFSDTKLAMHSRRQFLTFVSAALAPVPSLGAQASAPLRWIDATSMPLEGRGWEDQERLRHFDRLPAKAEKLVRGEVWKLSRHSTGMAVRFRTDASEIHVRYSLQSERLAMAHMPATGVSGIDLYARDSKGDRRWVAVTKPESQAVNAKLIGALNTREREFLAYLPLYNGMEKLEFGIPSGARFEAMQAREKPIVFYGTSITHGACASRPGMCHVALLGRRLDRSVMNLGFSGNGRMEMEIADLMIELDASMFVIDCLPNISRARDVTERTEPLVRRLRTSRPDTPILLVEDRSYGHAWIQEPARRRSQATRKALRAAYDRLVGDGVSRLYYLAGDNLLGADGDATTDGSHPNDLGFLRQADAMEPVLRKALS